MDKQWELQPASVGAQAIGGDIVRAKYDGTYDKTNLPDKLIMTSYSGICDGKITSLAVILNSPPSY
jgi:hypothetical protein